MAGHQIDLPNVCLGRVRSSPELVSNAPHTRVGAWWADRSEQPDSAVQPPSPPGPRGPVVGQTSARPSARHLCTGRHLRHICSTRQATRSLRLRSSGKASGNRPWEIRRQSALTLTVQYGPPLEQTVDRQRIKATAQNPPQPATWQLNSRGPIASNRPKLSVLPVLPAGVQPRTDLDHQVFVGQLIRVDVEDDLVDIGVDPTHRQPSRQTRPSGDHRAHTHTRLG